MKQMPKIEKVMTAMPHTINKDLPIHMGLDMMKKHGIRHLPVADNGKLIGVLTERDIRLAMTFNNAPGFKGESKVEDVMMPDPYTTTPDASLDEVVLEMAEHKYGCAIIQQNNGKIVGIFTSIDAMRAFGESLRQNYKL